MHHVRLFRPMAATFVAMLVLALVPAIAMAAPADHFQIGGPALVTSSVGHIYTVTALDGSNQPDASYVGTVLLMNGEDVLGSYDFIGGEGGSHAFVAVPLDVAGPHTVTATDGGLADGTLNVEVRAPGVATHLVMTMNATAKVDVWESLTVTAADDNGTTDTGYGDTVTIAGSSDGSAVLAFTHHFVPANNGTFTVANAVKFMTAGTHSVSVGDDAGPQLAGVANGIDVAKGDQTAAFTATVTTAQVTNTWTPVVTATSGLTTTITIDPASSAVCSIDGSHVVTMNGPGNCRVLGDQGGDANWNAAPQIHMDITVKNANAITFDTSAPVGAKVGDDYTPTAHASSGGAVAITVDASSSAVCSIGGGIVHMLAIGTCVVDFNQTGNGTYWSAPERQQSFGVGIATSSVAVTTSGTPSAYGDSVTFTATVTGGGDTPTGTVQFQDDGVNMGAAIALDGSGQAAKTVTDLTVKTHSITAIYSGDSNYSGNTSPGRSQVVNTATLSITASSGSFAHGGVVPTITPGYVGLKNGDLAPATPPTCSTTATITSPVGDYQSSCSGAADPNYTIGYTVGNIHVAQTTSTTSLGTSGTPTTYLGLVTFTATINYTGAVPTGTVQFKDGVSDLGTPVAVNGSGHAALAISSLLVGDHVVTAVYTGDTNYAGSTSGSVTQHVNGGAGTSIAVGTSGTPSVYGNSVTFTATITFGGIAPTGTVQFKSDGWNIGTPQAVDGSGQASYSTTALAAATHSITAVYSGDGSYTTSTSAGTSQVVNAAPLSITASGGSFSHGGVVPTITPIYVGRKNGDSQPSTPPVCSTTATSNSTVGDYQSSCSGAADTNYTISYFTGTVHLTIASSSTGLGTSGTPSTYLGSVTFTATVTGAGLTPGGTVQFQNGGVDLGAAQAVDGGGLAHLTVSTLSVADHSITAVYSGDTNHNGSSSSTLHQIVNGGATTSIAVGSSGTPSVYATSVTFTATITFGGVTPTGTIQFKNGGVDIGPAQAVNGSGQASYSTAALTVADHAMTAVYSGDGNYATSASVAFHQVVNGGAGTTTVLGTSGTPSAYGDSVTFTATVTGAGITPTGTVQFKSDGSTIGAPQAVDGTGHATYSTAALTVADHLITADYSGDTNYATSTATGIHQVVSAGGGSATIVNTSGTPSTYGDSVTFTATVSGGGSTPTGTVQFKRGVVDIGTPQAVDGTGHASITTSALSAADHSITAVYSGDVTYAGSTSAVIHQIVNQRTLTIKAANGSAVYHAAIPAIVASYTGLQNSEAAPATPPTCATDATNTSPVSGSYITFCSGAVDGNYDIHYTDGSFSISKATPVLAFVSSAPSATPGGAAYTPNVSTTSDSGNTIEITIDPGSSSVCTATDGVVSFIGLGTCLIYADEAASANWFAAAQKSQTVNVSAGAPTQLIVVAPGSATAGAPFTVTVTAKDSGGNLVPGYTGSIHFTSTDGAAVLPADYTFLPGDNGSKTFTNAATLKTVGAGTKTITATDKATGSLNGTSDPISMTAAAASKYTVTTGAGPVIPGASVSVTVTVQDAYNNTATTYTGTVHLSTGDGAASVGSDYTYVGGDAGVHTWATGLTLRTPGSQTVTARDTVTSSLNGTSAALMCGYPASTFTAIQPSRVLDTRPSGGGNTNMGLSGPFVVGNVRTFHVANAVYTGGGSAVAVPLGATAVTGNLTITGQGANTGLIALGPNMTPTGEVTTINFIGNENRANNVTVGLASDGTLQAVYRGTAGKTVNLIFDVTGYFTTATTGNRLHTVTPGRILDTRPNASGVTHMDPLTSGVKPYANRVVRNVKVIGAAGIGWSSPQVPAGAKAVTANITVTGASSVGYVAFGPTMTSTPATSTLNVNAGVNTANGITVALNNSGNLQAVWAGTNGSTANVILDITGYFTQDGTGLSYYPIIPTRMMDSATGRGGVHLFANEIPQPVTIGGVGQIPSDAGGISGNVTLTRPSVAGFVYVGPVGIVRAGVSTVNGTVGRSCANGFDVKLSSTNNGRIAVTWDGSNGSTATVAVDVTGYWK